MTVAWIGEDPWRKRCGEVAAMLVCEETVQQRRSYASAVAAALSLERTRKKKRQRGRESGEKTQGAPPPLFNHALKG